MNETLLGVLVGGAITLATTYLASILQERHARAREKAKAAAHMKTAARLVAVEFSLAVAVASRAVERGKWDTTDIEMIRSEALRKNRELIARQVDNPTWIEVHKASLGIRYLRSSHRFAILESGEFAEFAPQIVEAIGRYCDNIKSGTKALGAYAYEPKRSHTRSWLAKLTPRAILAAAQGVVRVHADAKSRP